jgi:hypothetical protein
MKRDVNKLMEKFKGEFGHPTRPDNPYGKDGEFFVPVGRVKTMMILLLTTTRHLVKLGMERVWILLKVGTNPKEESKVVNVNQVFGVNGF